MIGRYLWIKCALVVLLVLPLILLESLDGLSPAWFAYRVGGVPITVVVAVVLFAGLVILTAVFSATLSNSKGEP